jgi:hypothetical protein
MSPSVSVTRNNEPYNARRTWQKCAVEATTCIEIKRTVSVEAGHHPLQEAFDVHDSRLDCPYADGFLLILIR